MGGHFWGGSGLGCWGCGWDVLGIAILGRAFSALSLSSAGTQGFALGWVRVRLWRSAGANGLGGDDDFGEVGYTGEGGDEDGKHGEAGLADG